MQLLNSLSQVANRTFKSYEEAADFYISKTFLDTLSSPDIEYAIAYWNLTGYEPKYSAALEAYDLLKGLHPQITESAHNLTKKLHKARGFFLSQLPLSVSGAKTDNVQLNKMRKALNKRGQLIKSSIDYMESRVLTKEGLASIKAYFGESTVPFRIVLNEGTFDIDTYQFISLVLLLIGKTPYSVDGRFTHNQLTTLRVGLNKYSSAAMENSIPYEPITAADAEALLALTKSSWGDAPSILPVYANLREALEENNSAKIYNMCLVINAYKRYLIRNGLTMRSI